MPAHDTIDFVELGRKLGWDFGHFRMTPWDRALALPGFAEGHKEGQLTRAAPLSQEDGRITRKWLQVRMNALARGRVIDSNVTRELIQRIDCDSCPVSLLPMTHGELKDTDWSIDRINNDGGYAEGNLAVISTRANRAKGTKTFEQVLDLAKGNGVADGLTPQEWYRLASIMFGPCAYADTKLLKYLPFPLATRMTNTTVMPIWFHLQRAVLESAKSNQYRNFFQRQLKDFAEAKQVIECEMITVKLRNRLPGYKYEYDALISEEFQKRLYTWLNTFTLAMYNQLKGLLTSSVGGNLAPREQLESWSTGTRGYFF